MSEVPSATPPQTGAEHPQGVLVLVLGIVGLVVPMVSFVAWYFGNKARRDLRSNPGVYSSQLVTLGWVLGIVDSVATICFAAWVAIAVLLGGIAG